MKVKKKLNIEKYNKKLELYENLWNIINEITLNPSKSVEVFGDIYKGKFEVGNIVYIYNISKMENPYTDGGDFYNIQFHPKENKTSIPTGDSNKENYIKILNTLYKIISEFANEIKPNYIGISSMDNDGNKNYHTVYNNLTKNNSIKGYVRKNANLEFKTPQGKGRFIILKKIGYDK
jgi:hypothetical protein